MNKILIAFWVSVCGTACYAQAANSGGGPALGLNNAAIILFFLLVLSLPLLYFFAFKPIRRNMIERNLGFLAAVPPGLYIVLGLIILASAFFSIMLGDDISNHRSASRGDIRAALMIMYSGYFFGVLGGLLILAGLFKGIVNKSP